MKEEGVTLVEALVALVLGAAVLAAVLSTVRIAAKGADRARAASADAEGFARAGAILAGDAVHVVWTGDDEGRPMFPGQPDTVSLPQMPRPLVPQPMPKGPVSVVYHLAGFGAGTVLTRTEAGRPVTLWQSPGRLEFRFLDAKGGNGSAIGPTSTPCREPLPWPTPEEGTPRLVAELPPLLPTACATGPGPACPLPAEAFP